MLHFQSETYHYHRSKDVLRENGIDILIVFACLNIESEQHLGNYVREKLIEGPVVKIKSKASEGDPDLLSLPNKDVFYTLTQAEYNLLAETAHKDEKAFLLYKHVISN
ncbi:hypothetical protein [Viridibacillus arvi]|uniref:hypothetical protein n=1 Tax=Viridibacillus arvi TaxID=263475 RepID=UPI003D271F59